MKIIKASIAILVITKAAGPASAANLTCGSGTFLDEEVCLCDRDLACANEAEAPVEASNKIFLAGILDTDTFPWAAEVFDLVVSLLNNHTDGWNDDVLDDGTVVDFGIANS